MALNPSAFYDASATNNKRSTRTFKDLNLNMTRHPVTGDIVSLKDVDAIKRSVRNLVNTNFYEKPFHPEIGCNVRAMLFEPISPITANRISNFIEDTITDFEPRVELSSISVNPQLDNNSYSVTVEFYIVNVDTELQTLDIILERTR